MKDIKEEKILFIPDISGSMSNEWIDNLRKIVKEGTELEKWEAKMKLNCEYGVLYRRRSYNLYESLLAKPIKTRVEQEDQT